MHYTFQLPEFLVQNSLSVPTQVFQECWCGVSPAPENENLVGTRMWRLISVSPLDTISLVLVFEKLHEKQTS